MAGFETPKYIPPKPIVPKHKPGVHPRMHSPDFPGGRLPPADADDAAHWIEGGSEDAMQGRVNTNWLEKERRMKGHVQGPWKLTPAEENENMIRNTLHDVIRGNKPFNNNPFKPPKAETLPLLPKFQPPRDHPVRGMVLPPYMSRKPGPPNRTPVQGR